MQNYDESTTDLARNVGSRVSRGMADMDALILQGAGLSPWPLLLVEPSLADAAFIGAALASAPFRLLVTNHFQEAKALLDSRPPMVLISEIRLGEFNGLQLVLRAKAAQLSIAAVVTSHVADPVLQSEAERMGATFVVKPATSSEFLAAVCRTAFRRSTDQSPDPIRPPYERRRRDRRTTPVPIAIERRTSERRVALAATAARPLYAG